ncbi:MAG TPA: CPBP family intramembrane glutamic endopeptidase [Alphaproteobacteria bacterium]|nr:CPBP family intramembrane glutamic endopeptidase [Alphaproteobacteria bacterium]
MQNVPRLMVILAVGMGALISPICEQAGFWGYGQGILQRKLSGVTAIVFSALTFAVLPHPPLHAPYLPKLVFFFLIGLTFAVTAHLTKSILPGLLVHILGLLAFFTLVWPHDPSRQLLSQGGADTSFYIHAALAVLFAALAVLAFIRLAKVSEPVASV